ncbi:hypothetical protein AOQ84DRAFT_354212 [Glonium stellatum]|uniref:F-box domain-containing protein n=1 Tax=Glonium stellatum TaxID=574774 RepID=A0A8E2JTK8_9PEZI|nr:hypothetical protein AOQ84DRAFT_354212 [Glonium stellatum]
MLPAGLGTVSFRPHKASYRGELPCASNPTCMNHNHSKQMSDEGSDLVPKITLRARVTRVLRLVNSKPDIRNASQESEALRRKGSDSSLMALPVELLQEISSHLKTSDAACFALTSRSIRNTIGVGSWYMLKKLGTKLTGPWGEDLSAARAERINFLERIVRGLPDYWLCQHCLILHSRLRITTSQSWDTIRTFPGCDVRLNFLPMSDQIFGYSLAWYHAYLAMMGDSKRPLCLDSLTCSGTYRSVEYTISPRIYENSEFLLKGYYRIHLDDRELLQLHIWKPHSPKRGKWDEILSRRGFSRLCNHVYYEPDPTRQKNRAHWKPTTPTCSSFKPLTELVDCRWRHIVLEEGPCENCNRIKRCPVCPTEFDLNFTHIPAQLTEVIIEVWHNLGAGVTTFDARWESMTGPTKQDPYLFEPGSIRRAYEKFGYPGGRHYEIPFS